VRHEALYAGILAPNLRVIPATGPRVVGMPRSLSASAMPFLLVMPAARSSVTIGARPAARLLARCTGFPSGTLGRSCKTLWHDFALPDCAGQHNQCGAPRVTSSTELASVAECCRKRRDAGR
jgi:hypothetical protein